LYHAGQAWIIRDYLKTTVCAAPAFRIEDYNGPRLMNLKYFLPVLASLLVSTSAFAASPSAETLIGACARCHGADGNSPGQYPSLARQNAEYTAKQLRDFKSGARKDNQMSPMVGVLTEENIPVLAKYYAGEFISRPRGIDKELAAQGEKIAVELKCASCHQKNYRGKKEVPRLSRQQRVYLVKQMTNYRDGTRTNDNGVKTPEVKNLTDDQIKALSHYFSGM
jgi:cytochrome c553